jgi:hypothetical protein
MIAKVDERLKDRDMGVELLPAAKTLLSERGYDPATPPRRSAQLPGRQMRCPFLLSAQALARRRTASWSDRPSQHPS